jgi:hypothetical protein
MVRYGVDRPGEWLELIEVTAHIRSFMSRGVDIMETTRSSDQDHPAAFACLAIGMEQLLKVTLGLIHADETGGWPGLKTFRTFGHDIDDLNGRVHDRLAARRSLATHARYIEGLATEFAADPVLPLMIGVLTDYGSAGRYVHLDALADPGTADVVTFRATPQRTWYDEVEGALIREDPTLLDTVMAGDRSPLNRAAGSSLRRWYDYIGANWVHGVAGERAKRFGLTLRLDA